MGDAKRVTSHIRKYWNFWLVIVFLLVAARFTIFRNSSENVRLVLFSIYAAPTWLAVMILHYYKGKRLWSYLKKNHKGKSISPLTFLYSKDDLGDNVFGELKKDYRRFIALALTIFFTLPVLFLTVMLFSN